MSTLRYSGEIRIRVTYSHTRTFNVHGETVNNGSYRCFLRGPGGMTATVIVNAPAYLSHAVDSPEAFDDATRAAISFEDQDDSGERWHDHVAYARNAAGWHVGRTEAHAWPKIEECKACATRKRAGLCPACASERTRSENKTTIRTV